MGRSLAMICNIGFAKGPSRHSLLWFCWWSLQLDLKLSIELKPALFTHIPILASPSFKFQCSGSQTTRSQRSACESSKQRTACVLADCR